jgi:uncharacterized membrane protein YedE/YeeE
VKNLAGLIGGMLFGAGLVIGGMTDPAKVLAFLTIGPDWDATLIFVLGAAVVVTTAGYWLVGKRAAPLFDADFHAPTSQLIDARLIGGAAIFGVGWGITGYCPGPALVGVMTFDPRAAIFLMAFVVGLSIYEKWFAATATTKVVVATDG